MIVQVGTLWPKSGSCHRRTGVPLTFPCTATRLMTSLCPGPGTALVRLFPLPTELNLPPSSSQWVWAPWDRGCTWHQESPLPSQSPVGAHLLQRTRPCLRLDGHGIPSLHLCLLTQGAAQGPEMRVSYGCVSGDSVSPEHSPSSSSLRSYHSHREEGCCWPLHPDIMENLLCAVSWDGLSKLGVREGSSLSRPHDP